MIYQWNIVYNILNEIKNIFPLLRERFALQQVTTS